VYEVIRLAGAAYLVVLGVVPLVGQAIGRTRVATPAAVGRSPQSRRTGLRPAFAAGLISDVLNPKIGLFYVAVVPQFVPPGRPPLGYSLLLCAIDVAVALVWLLTLTWAAHAVSWLHRPAVVRWSERCFSACLIAIGGSVALGW
jgi:threonine/homoserine/homoserine lactone efflux protein